MDSTRVKILSEAYARLIRVTSTKQWSKFIAWLDKEDPAQKDWVLSTLIDVIHETQDKLHQTANIMSSRVEPSNPKQDAPALEVKASKPRAKPKAKAKKEPSLTMDSE